MPRKTGIVYVHEIDEYDDEEEDIVECKKDEWDVNGLITLSELSDEIEITILEEDEDENKENNKP